TGQALFCFALVLGLRYLSLGLGGRLPLPVRTGVVLTAFLFAPPVLMALLLTTRPREGLAVRRPRPAYLLVAVLLLPLAEGVQYLLHLFPTFVDLTQARQSLAAEASPPGSAAGWGGLVVLALLPAVCREVRSRGFILSGLRRRFRPWTAIVLSSLLFALYHNHVFMLLPLFVLGVVLGVLAVRSGSIWPGVLLHAGCYALL